MKVVQVVLYKMEEIKSIIKVDGFRFIENLNTTTRQLIICSQIVKAIGNKQLPKEFLEKKLLNWSLNIEKNEEYKNQKGKITENNKKTSALPHYFELSKSIGLISNINQIYSITRLSHIMIHFMDNESNNLKLTLFEKIFYLFLLIKNDADGFLFLLDSLNKTEYNQKDLKENFQSKFNERLQFKNDSAENITRNLISEKFRVINFIWKKPEVYAEHFLIPRCEWLNSLGLININHINNKTIYSLSSIGIEFYKIIPFINIESQIKDINEDFITNIFFTIINKIYFQNSNENFDKLSHDKKINLLGEAIDKSLTIIKSSSSFRIPMFDAMLYISIDFILNKNIVINFKDIFDLLKIGVSYKNKEYILKDNGRINESYITTRVKL